MGTRNTLKVLYNGKTVISQYGQWDGYPTGQGARILRVLRDEKKMENILRIFDNGKICLMSIEEAQSLLDALKKVKVVDGLDLTQTLIYCAPMSRDYRAGGVLEYLANLPTDLALHRGMAIPVYADGDEPQEGNYVLDISTKDFCPFDGWDYDYTLTMEYHGYEHRYTRAEVEAMEDPDAEMEAWERYINHEEDC